MLMLRPSRVRRRNASTPASVDGILISTLGRSTSSRSSCARRTAESTSKASAAPCGRGALEGERGLLLDRDVAVGAAGALPHGAEEVASLLDVADRAAL